MASQTMVNCFALNSITGIQLGKPCHLGLNRRGGRQPVDHPTECHVIRPKFIRTRKTRKTNPTSKLANHPSH